MDHLRRLIQCVVWVALVLVVQSNYANADLISIAGQFGSDFQGVSGLAGGSFSGTFEVFGLPAQPGPGNNLFLSNINVDLRNSQGQLVTTLSFAGILSANTRSTLGIDVVGIAEGSFGLQLDFAAPYLGNGSIIPTDLALYNGFASELTTSGGKAEIISGAAAAPEPRSLSLLGLGALGLLGIRWRRMRRRDHDACYDGFAESK